MKIKQKREDTEHHYILRSIWNTKWVYISYIPEIYYKKKDNDYMLFHQNRREALVIGKIFFALGYNVKVALYNAIEECDNRQYDIIFGLEPNFITMSKKNSQALKIYYATGAYWEHQYNMVKNRTDQFNIEHKTHLPYSRLVYEHNSCNIANVIFQIGSIFTLQTYPKHLQDKIKIIHQSSNFIRQCDLKWKLNKMSRTDFIWFGSSGSILKGLDLVLDYFISHPQYSLHVVGPIDAEFMEYYQRQLEKHENIFFYGFLSTDSEQFMKLAYQCAFNIFPSASEGGCPGSVITLMQMGVIPILSQWAALDNIEQYGYLLPTLSIDAIDKAIQWAAQLPIEKIHKLVENNILYSKRTWNLELFEKEFSSTLQETINNHINHKI